MPTPKKGAAKATGSARGGPTGALALVMKKGPEPPPSDPQKFFDWVDWEDWYHEYATATARGGQPQYASTFAFAKVKASNRIQRDLILHVIGPVIQGKTPMYKDIPQFDWDRARKAGFWLGPEKLKDELAEILKNTDAVAELRGSAQAHLLPMLARITGMMEKIESSFMGQIFLTNLSAKENEARADLYMRLTDNVVRQTIQLQQAYAFSLAININDLSGTIAMRDSVASTVTSEQGKGARQAESFLGRVIEMTGHKAQALKLPLPDPDIVAMAQEIVREA